MNYICLCLELNPYILVACRLNQPISHKEKDTWWQSHVHYSETLDLENKSKEFKNIWILSRDHFSWVLLGNVLCEELKLWGTLISWKDVFSFFVWKQRPYVENDERLRLHILTLFWQMSLSKIYFAIFF